MAQPYRDSSGNAADYPKAGLRPFPACRSRPTGPTITSVVKSPPKRQHSTRVRHVTLTLDSERGCDSLAGGAPDLTLNDGGSATYTGGSGTMSWPLATRWLRVKTRHRWRRRRSTLTAPHQDGARQHRQPVAERAHPGRAAIYTMAASSLAIDGNGFFDTSSSLSDTVTLTTTYVNDVIILNIVENGPAFSSVIRYGWPDLASEGGCGNGGTSLIYQYYAISPNALSADVITVNFSGTPYAELNAFGVAAQIRHPRSIPTPRYPQPPLAGLPGRPPAMRTI